MDAISRSLAEDLAKYGWEWLLFGLIGQMVFQGRFYLQWLASEREKKSVVPVAFWYLSCVGTLMLVVYAVRISSAIGVLSNGLNIVVYARNLVHIWRNEGKLTKRMHTVVHAVVAFIAVISVFLMAYVWVNKIHETQPTKTWIWLAIGAVGTLLFGCRFIIQWVATERARKSVVPNVFWYFSIVATFLQLASFVHTREWIFVLGSAIGIVIYARNLWFIHRPGGQADAAGAA